MLMITLSGCATMGLNDLFSSYHSQMQVSKQAALNGNYVTALDKLPDYNERHNSYALAKLEEGRLHYLMGDWQKSQQSFDIVYNEVEKQSRAAKYQISKGVQNVGAVLSNDSALNYQIPSYEQGMLHTYQALNFAFQGDLTASLVEVRRANLVQEQALRDNQQSIEKAKSSLLNEGVDVTKLYSAYPDMSGVIGGVKNNFQNAFTFYLSGVLYEINGDLNDAYIDYKRALEISTDNKYIQQDVLRLAHTLNMQDELALFEKELDVTLPRKSKTDPNGGEAIIIVEQGLVPSRQNISLNLPVFTRHNDIRFFSFSLPVYKQSTVSSKFALTHKGLSYGAEDIVQVQSLAAKSLVDELPWLLSRQVVRVVAKEELRRKMAKEGGDLGNIIASIYNVTTEKADTRSWSTLPAIVKVIRMPLQAGNQVLSLSNGRDVTNISLDVSKGSRYLLNVIDVGGKLRTRQVAY